MDAEDRGAFASVWVDEQGHVAEGPMVNVAFVTPGRELVLPEFDRILSGCTARRLLALAPKLVEDGRLTAVTTRNITADQAKRSLEMAFVGSGLPVGTVAVTARTPSRHCSYSAGSPPRRRPARGSPGGRAGSRRARR